MSSTTTGQGNTTAAIKFLQKWKAKGPWTLTSISPLDRKIETTTFAASQVEDMRAWIDRRNGSVNLYFSVNSLSRPVTSKASKEDVHSAEWLHVDVDPRDSVDTSDPDSVKAERERILGMFMDARPKSIPEPTVVIFSGAGYQAFWRLKEPVLIDGTEEKWSDFELYNRRLEQIFGGDHCHNVDRIMRLPGTVNVPDAKKKAKGRTPTPSQLLHFTDNDYPLSAFKQASNTQNSFSPHDGAPTINISGPIRRLSDISELDEWGVRDRIKTTIVQGNYPGEVKQKDNSRSAWLFEVVCELVRVGVPDEVIYSVITDPAFNISASVVERGSGTHRYAIKQIVRAKEHTIDKNLATLNDKHAVIGNVGGKCRVIEEVWDDVVRRSRLTFSSFEDVRNRYNNQMVALGTDENGEPIAAPLGNYWLKHPNRRQFDHIRFCPKGDTPGVYNLWQGFAVDPRPGDCSLYLEHLLHNICSGNQSYYEYLIKWMARAVQYPEKQGEVAVVLQGAKGTGKSLMARVFGELFGRHYLMVSNSSHLVGNFNAHLRDVVVLFADEAFFAGDRKHESVLKTLVTESTLNIEQKGVDVETSPNYIHLIMAANEMHVVRASGDERRYFVLEVGQERKQDSKFFGDLVAQMEAGGYSALLMMLQDLDITDFNVRDVPQTEALVDQKKFSLSNEEEWWYRKLEIGTLFRHDSEWRRYASVEDLLADYIADAERYKYSRRSNETSLGRFIAKEVPHVAKQLRTVTSEVYDGSDGRPSMVTRRVNFYDFGTLEQCRAIWEQRHGKEKWPEDEPRKREVF